MKFGRCNLDVDRELWTRGNRWWCLGDGWWMSSGWDQVVTHQPTITQYYYIAQPTTTQRTTNQPTTTQQCRHRTKQEPPNTMYRTLYCNLYIRGCFSGWSTTTQPKPTARFDHLVMVTLPYKYSASVSFYLWAYWTCVSPTLVSVERSREARWVVAGWQVVPSQF